MHKERRKSSQTNGTVWNGSSNSPDGKPTVKFDIDEFDPEGFEGLNGDTAGGSFEEDRL